MGNPGRVVVLPDFTSLQLKDPRKNGMKVCEAETLFSLSAVVKASKLQTQRPADQPVTVNHNLCDLSKLFLPPRPQFLYLESPEVADNSNFQTSKKVTYPFLWKSSMEAQYIKQTLKMNWAALIEEGGVEIPLPAPRTPLWATVRTSGF